MKANISIVQKTLICRAYCLVNAILQIMWFEPEIKTLLPKSALLLITCRYFWALLAIYLCTNTENELIDWLVITVVNSLVWHSLNFQINLTIPDGRQLFHYNILTGCACYAQKKVVNVQISNPHVHFKVLHHLKHTYLNI